MRETYASNHRKSRKQTTRIYSHRDDDRDVDDDRGIVGGRSEEHTSELQSRFDIVCRLLLEKKNLVQPSTLGSGGYDFTTVPRVEGEFTYNRKAGKNSQLFWVGGLWQTTKDAPTGGASITSFGGTAGIKAGFSDFSVVLPRYLGYALFPYTTLFR